MARSYPRHRHSWNDYALHTYGPPGSRRRHRMGLRARLQAARQTGFIRYFWQRIFAPSQLGTISPPGHILRGYRGHVLPSPDEHLRVQVRGKHFFAQPEDDRPYFVGDLIIVTGQAGPDTLWVSHLP